MEMSKLCYNCIQPRICYLPGKLDSDGEEIGWCKYCNLCGEKDCENEITCRVKWEICLKDPFLLCRDVCKDHLSIPDLFSDECLESARNQSIKEYTYL